MTRRPLRYVVLIGLSLLGSLVALLCALFFGGFRPGIPLRDPLADKILEAYRAGPPSEALEITYPLDGTLFPPEIVAPTFRWNDPQAGTPPAGTDTWAVGLRFQDAKEGLSFLATETQWTPSPQHWEAIKRRSLETVATVTVVGVRREEPKKTLSAACITISTSRDEVGAPIFYREVNLPFIEAVRDPSQIRWHFGSISSPEQPPVVLEKLPVCGNCHSFPRDGKTLAMDVDYANNKGSYVITRVAEQMVLATSDVITWNDYKKEDGEQTFGLLSQVSPDGKHVVSTVKDKSVFVPKPGLAFSQLFFPIKGILAVYDRQSGTFRSLPGADDPQFVQSNPSWSPDGKYIVFARSEAYDLKHTVGRGKVLLTAEECEEFLKDGKPFLFDLYRIPFNGGEGGKAEPVEGASHNGMSNFFAKYSPDGKWIVFCKAKSYMLLQPDSELYIIPAEGGQARRLRANTPRMNSWHSWSPNSRWLVFSSKANSAYTQLFLTHIDQQGRSTPAVLLSQLTAPDRAANIPEFVNTGPGAIKRIREQFLDDYSYVRAADEFYQSGEADSAIRYYQQAVELNPANVKAQQRLGFLLHHVKGRVQEAMVHSAAALRLDPDNARAHYDLAMALFQQRELGRAIGHFRRALQGTPQDGGKVYNRADIHYNLGMALYLTGEFREAAAHLSEAVRLRPEDARIHYSLALILAAQGQIDQTLQHYSQAVQLQPEVDTSATLHHFMGVNYAKAGRLREAVLSAEKALKLARAAGAEDLTRQIERQVQRYQRDLEAEPQ
jgi:tetratricopeptide (TPR) repeat protein